ncbi:hypothetical protein ES705_24923 [subsurface metagenome]
MFLQNGEEVLRIDKKKLSILVSDGFTFFILGAGVGGIIGFILFSTLKEIKGIPFFIPLLSMGVPILLMGYLGARWTYKSNKQTKLFYVSFSGDRYKVWEEGRSSKAKKGQTKNIHVQITRVSPVKGTFGIKIRRESGYHIYDGDCLIKQDTDMIRDYFKKHRVQTIN